MMDVLCPLCGLPAESVTVWSCRLIGCPCAAVYGNWAISLPAVAIVSLLENHDPGDEDRS